MAFDLSSAQPVTDTTQGTHPANNFDIQSARPVDVTGGDKQPKTAWEEFQQSGRDVQMMSEKASSPVKDTEDLKPQLDKQVKDQYPPHSFLNQPLGSLRDFSHLVGDDVYSTFGKPLGLAPEANDAVNEEQAQLTKNHPVESILAGTVPFIATAPIFPQGLLGLTAQFASISGLSEWGRQRMDESLMKPTADKLMDVARETSKGALMGPIWHYSGALKFVSNPIGQALIRAGIRGAGTATLDKVYGSDLTSAFKDGGIMTALSLIFETPALGRTVLGRGILENTNQRVYESLFGGQAADKIAQTTPVIPKINPEANDAEVQKTILDSANTLATQLPVQDNKIVAATVKTNDGIVSHGADHEQALNKLGMSKAASFEGKDFQAGFTTSEGKFITREESKQDPYNLPNGSSQDVEGLNHQKFFTSPDLPDIVNPQTLKGRLEGEEGKMDVRLIPGVVEVSEGMARAAKEYVENLEPTTVSGAAEFTSQDLRERLGKQAQLMDRLEVLLTGAKKVFDRATKESITESYTRAERGEKQDTPELQKFYDTLKYILANTRERVRALGKGKLENAIENYLPHIWEDPKKANMISKFFARRPFEGSKSFLKKRTIENFADGIEAGLTPVSWNPVDLTMLKVREMEKYILAHSALKANVASGFAKYIKIGSQSPDGWQKLNDNISQVLKSPYTEVKEFFDEKMMTGLNKAAKGLGIDVDRLLKLKGVGKDTAGYSKIGKSGAPGAHEDPLLNTSGNKKYPDEVRTKFATPESVLAHEIGHQIDNIFGMKDIFLKDKRLTLELRKLADLRYEGKDPSQGFKDYVRKGSEKMAVMLEAYIHAPDKFKEVAPNAYKLFQDVLSRDERLKPLLDIKPSLVLGQGKADVYAGGIVIAGHYYAHPDSARIFNNYLSPGLRGKWIYDTYRSAGNSLVQFRLGISAFHAGFTTLDATISVFAKGINRLFKGDVKGFATATAKTLIPLYSPITNFIRGRELFQSWYGKDNGAMTNLLAEMYASGGGRAKMDKFYATQFDQTLNKALKEGKLLTAALQTPFWLTQQMSRPLMEYLVPRQKMGVFADLMKMEIEDNPNMSHEQMRATAQRIVNSVDNRMGQLVYDNLMVNRTMKDLGMASVQSLGWNIGSVREIGGGIGDLAKNLNDLRQGRPTEVSYRTAYIMALPMVVGLYGAVYQYLATGIWPNQTDTPMKDLFHPRTAGLDKNGLPARVNLPSYMKDIGSFMEDPVKTAVNKLNPVNSELVDMFQNKDYFGTEIRNPDDPWVQQAMDELAYIGKGFEPYSFENLSKSTRTDIASKIEPFIGITPARYDIDMTKAEKAALELEKGHIPQGARTKEATAHSKARSDLRNNFLVSHDEQPLIDAVAAGTITSKEKRSIVKEKNMSRIERLTQHLTADEVLSLIPKAESDDEKQDLEKIAKKKISNKRGAGTWTSEDQDLYKKFMPENDQ